MTQHVGPSNPTTWPCITWLPNRADLICHATQYITQYVDIIFSNPISWRCLHSSYFRCTNVYNIYHVVITISAHQAYTIISTQQFNITSYITISQGSDHSLRRMKCSLQRSCMLAVATTKFAIVKNLNIEESSTRAYLLQRSPILLQWVLSISTNQNTNLNLSMPVAVRANPAAASTHGSV